MDVSALCIINMGVVGWYAVCGYGISWSYSLELSRDEAHILVRTSTKHRITFLALEHNTKTLCLVSLSRTFYSLLSTDSHTKTGNSLKMTEINVDWDLNLQQNKQTSTKHAILYE